MFRELHGLWRLIELANRARHVKRFPRNRQEFDEARVVLFGNEGYSTRHCPWCAERIRAAASFCNRCERDVIGPDAPEISTTCLNCGEIVKMDVRECPRCRADIVVAVEELPVVGRCSECDTAIRESATICPGCQTDAGVALRRAPEPAMARTGPEQAIHQRPLDP